jgi:predicted Zn-dependent protease with MMP-like domain
MASEYRTWAWTYAAASFVDYDGGMTFEVFRSVVEEMYREIPEAFLEGLQGVHVLPEARPEEEFEDVWRLGEYLDPGPESFLGGGEGLGRHIALYYGSFAKVAEGDSAFDWEEEIWETLTHELRHHVESLAGDVSLIEDDMMHAATFPRRNDG